MRSMMAGLIALLVVGVSVSTAYQAPEGAVKKRKVVKTEAEWAKLLNREQFLVTRQKHTEPPGTGKYANHHGKGIYTCVCCGAFLFRSSNKFESGTGWPSFYQPFAKEKIDSEIDNSTGDARIEVMCSDCGAHLGHVFDDGPAPTGQRYCINSASLKFLTEAQAKAALQKQKEQEAKEKEEPKVDAKPKTATETEK